MRVLIAAFCLCAAPALAQSTLGEVPQRPGDPNGAAPMWDGVAECSAILAAASSRATSRIDRDNMQAAASAWFAATFDLAAQDGAEVSPEELGEYVSGWAGQIGSVGALTGKADWMTYCAFIGGQNGLDARIFRENMPAEDLAEG